jgi:hypothetical protein
MVSRQYGPGNTVPSSPISSELRLTKEHIADIEYRFEALKPYQTPGSPTFAPALQGQLASLLPNCPRCRDVGTGATP